VHGRAECSPKGVASVAAAVIAEHALDGDPVLCEEGGRPDPERRCRRALLVCEDFAVGKAAVAVDGRVHKRVPDLGAVPASALGHTTVDPPAAPVGYAPELLHVDMHEFARTVHLDAPHRLSRGPVQVVEAVEAVTGEDPVHC
jgi:hypothetical protein